jgi:hypothetical protein
MLCNLNNVYRIMPTTDNYQERYLLRIDDYEFQDNEGIRDKFLIVLNRNEESAYIIHTLTTSNPNGFNPKTLGCSTIKNISYFYFPKDTIIGENGYFFEKDTFIFFNNNLRKESLSSFSKYADENVNHKDILKKEIFKKLIDCMLNSNFITFEQADILTKTRNKI